MKLLDLGIMSKLIKEAERKLKSAELSLAKAQLKVHDAKKALISARAEKLFTCHSCGWFEPRKHMSLIRMYYVERGLGYSDDTEHFSDYYFKCSHCKTLHRFLTEEAVKNHDLPYKEVERYGEKRIEQYHNSDFEKTFKEVVECRLNSGYNYINVYK